MENKKKILFITSRMPFPPNSGRKNVMYNYCKIMSEKIGCKIVIASFTECGDDLDLKPNFIDRVYKLKNVSGLIKIKNIIFNTLIKRKFPIQVSLFWDEDIKKEIDDIIKYEKPDIVIADMIRMTEYLKDCNIYKIANIDDVISLRYKRQLNINMKYNNPYGAYLYSLPQFIQKILSINLVKKIILLNEIKLLEKYELDICKLYDKSIVVAYNEAKLVNEKLGNDKVISVPLGVDVEYYSELFNENNKSKNIIGFLGAMSVSHNEAGIIHFIENIFPYIKQKNNDVKLLVVGGGVTSKLKKYSSEDIIFTGRVDDIRIHLSKCRVFICPLIFGSGIKTKNLEAMAMGIPIVTTKIGAENIHAQNNTDWIIEDNDEKFAVNVINIINDNYLFENIRKNALEFVKNNFTWNVAEKELRDLIDSIFVEER